MNIFSPTEQATKFITQHLEVGGRAIDATAGNGWDTLALAETVGESGKVYGFDVQAGAISATRSLLGESNVLERVTLFEASHEMISERVDEPVHAVMFNLGYFPGGDQSIVTQPESTCAALAQALDLLLPKGVMSIVTYPGHPGGAEEQRAVARWLSMISDVEIAHLELLHRRSSAPQCFLLRKSVARRTN